MTTAAADVGPEEQPVRVWDLPTRTFHWLLAFLVIFSVVSAKIGGNAMVWHMRSGYAIFTLLAFRLVWGFAGGHWSRFRAFLYAPTTSLRYLRGESLPNEHHHVGHNPLGAGSVFALFGILAVQVASGLIADDEIATTGPLIKYVSSATSELATRWHKNYGQWIIVALVVLQSARSLSHGSSAGRTWSGRCGTATSCSPPTCPGRSTTAGRGRSPWRSSCCARSR